MSAAQGTTTATPGTITSAPRTTRHGDIRCGFIADPLAVDKMTDPIVVSLPAGNVPMDLRKGEKVMLHSTVVEKFLTDGTAYNTIEPRITRD